MSHVFLLSESCLPVVSGKYFYKFLSKNVFELPEQNKSWMSYLHNEPQRCGEYKDLVLRRLNMNIIKKHGFHCEQQKFDNIIKFINSSIDSIPKNIYVVRQQILLCKKHISYFANHIEFFEELYAPVCEQNPTIIRGGDEVFIVNFIILISQLQNELSDASKIDNFLHDEVFYTHNGITDADFSNHNYGCGTLKQRSAAYQFTLDNSTNVFDYIKILSSHSLFIRKVTSVDIEFWKHISKRKKRELLESHKETPAIRIIQSWFDAIHMLDQKTQNFSFMLTQKIIDRVVHHFYGDTYDDILKLYDGTDMTKYSDISMDHCTSEHAMYTVQCSDCGKSTNDTRNNDMRNYECLSSQKNFIDSDASNDTQSTIVHRRFNMLERYLVLFEIFMQLCHDDIFPSYLIKIMREHFTNERGRAILDFMFSNQLFYTDNTYDNRAFLIPSSFILGYTLSKLKMPINKVVNIDDILDSQISQDLISDMKLSEYDNVGFTFEQPTLASQNFINFLFGSFIGSNTSSY